MNPRMSSPSPISVLDNGGTVVNGRVVPDRVCRDWWDRNPKTGPICPDRHGSSRGVAMVDRVPN